MKSNIILSVALFCLGTFALSANSQELTNESGFYEVEIQEAAATTVPSDAHNSLDSYFQNEHILESGKNIRFMKNPCAGIKGYRLQNVRGFAFEDGIVKKFQNNGLLTTENIKYKSLGHFVRARKLCEPQFKKMPSMRLNVYMTEIW
jgi:hypothetical protein